MKTVSYLTSIAGAALMAGLSAQASAAVVVSGSIDHIESHTSGDGLLVSASALPNSNFSVNLNTGTPVTISNFLQISTTEGSVELFEDTVAKAFTVFFNFDSPFDALGLVSGSTTGFYTPSLFGSCGVFAGGCGAVNFDLATFTFGAGNSGSFSLDLSDAIFTTPGKANVSATFTLLNEPRAGGGGLPVPTAPVPEPGTWMMLIAGFAFVGAAMRRRQQPKVRFNFA